MKDNFLLDKLSKSNQQSNRVVYELLPLLLANQMYFKEVASYCLHPDPVMQARAFELLDKVFEAKPNWAKQYQTFVLSELTSRNIPDKARWALAKIISRFELNHNEAEQAFSYCLQAFKNTSSRITMALMLEALVSIAKAYPAQYAYQANHLLEQSLASPIPALSARARKLSKARRPPF